MARIYNCCAWGGQRNTTQKYLNALSKCKYKCKCGHVVVITYINDYCVCSWCGKKVFKDERTDFKDRLRRLIYKKVNE